ncbi:uncharacterized protein LOC126987547 isoform X2 [Eriocheir sinensis]|uniref:uncharacterized protein LOC126987547 isoform X2 n=1 Tax=Eriocheir sinensis TaxID=95602 RepID=UPI0021C7E991|nr:uncharacterized protein LOC126987547 isoform X2 [Eriocheir sinensis]
MDISRDVLKLSSAQAFEGSLGLCNVFGGLRLRVVLTVLVKTCTFCLVVLGLLAYQGAGPFQHGRGSDNVPFLACLRPARHYHLVLIPLYCGLLFAGFYAVAMVVVKVKGTGGRHRGVVPSSFLLVLVVSLSLNVGLLFAEDRRNASASLALSLLLSLSNSVALCFLAVSFWSSAKTIYRESIADFWLNVAVLNIMATYVAWSLIQFIISLGVFLTLEKKMNEHDVCSGELIVFIVLLLAWSLFENSALSHCCNTIIMHYLVLMYFLVMVIARQSGSPDQMLQILSISSLVVTLLLLAVRLAFLVRMNRGSNLCGSRTQETPQLEESPAP